MAAKRTSRLSRAILGAWIAGGFVLLYILVANAQVTTQLASNRWREEFARPTAIPHPANNPPTPEKIALGARLFSDPRLSANGKIACSTCHNPTLGFADGVAQSTAGTTGIALRRHTPALWNLAWAPVLYWDGRAASLEDQARFPMSHPDEMASSPDAVSERLSNDDAYRSMFRAAFPDQVNVTGDMILQALAAYERTLVSPPTRFDRWIEGDAMALAAEEVRGFGLFTGRAQCVNCHSGFAFTDHSFHDIGLPGNDRGRGPIAGVGAVDFAFKTPSLRELVWTAPYMHDGSLATLEDVVGHYERGGLRRPSRSRDMPKPFRLSPSERRDLVAFIEALSSDRAPKASTEAWIGTAATTVSISDLSVDATTVHQRDKKFHPIAIRVVAGSTVTIRNDDTRTHNIRIVDPRLSLNSGAQEPGESVRVTFPERGQFEAHCGIHPTMRLRIEVE